MATRVGREKFIGTIKSDVRENPMFGAKSAALPFLQAELWKIFCKNSPIFVTVTTMVGPGKIRIAPLNQPFPKTPVWCKIGGSSICTSQVMADLGRK